MFRLGKTTNVSPRLSSGPIMIGVSFFAAKSIAVVCCATARHDAQDFYFKSYGKGGQMLAGSRKRKHDSEIFNHETVQSPLKYNNKCAVDQPDKRIIYCAPSKQ